MKTIQYFFFVVLGCVLMAADCSNKDSEFYNDIYVTIPELVTIETQNSYAVNDVLWLNSDNFSRYLTEPNQTTQLDVLKTTNAQSFSFTYLLEKKVGTDTWELVLPGNALITQRGSAVETDLFIAAACVYNAGSEEYEFRSGIRLTQPGEYRLSFGYNSVSTTAVELRSDSFNNNLFLNINSPNTELDGSGNYNFTVSE